MKKLLFASLLMGISFSIAPLPSVMAQDATLSQTPNTEMTSEKKNIGPVLALYPQPILIVGAEVDGKINWLVVGQTGIVGQDKILVGINKTLYKNHGIKESKKFSINVVSPEILSKTDNVGKAIDQLAEQTKVFEYFLGENGTAVIKESPVTMECKVVGSFETEGFDNFLCSIATTYADPKVLDDEGKLDYTKLKPVLYEFPNHSYLATGEVLGKTLKFDQEPHMVAKLPMGPDGIVRLSTIEVFPEFLDDYLKFAAEVGETSLRTEPGVLTMYAVQEKDNPNIVTILETYATKDAYESHIKTPHFQKYKQGTMHMVKDLKLVDQQPLNPVNKLNNYIE